ncbi:MAG: V-type ATP synthase subunit I [Candidatus Aenigmarchaeota archaeon]|nr:V-type ATP synthase subunit I [Candidatus Aenigmarchaeota archaeon]
MFLPARMCRLDCVIADGKKEELMNALHSMGITQVEHLGDRTLQKISLERDEPLDKVADVSNLLVRIRKIIDILAVFEARAEKNILADMLGVDYTDKKKVKDMNYEETIKAVGKLLDGHEDEITGLSDDIQKLSTTISGLSEKLKTYSLYENVKEKIDDFGESNYLYCVLGSVPAANLENIRTKLDSELKKDYSLESQLSEGRAIISVAVKKRQREKLDAVLRECGFDGLRMGGSGRVSDIIDSLESGLKEYRKEEKEKRQKLKSIFEKSYKDFLVIEEILHLQMEKAEIFINCGKTSKTTVIRLWAQKKDADEVEKTIKKITEGKCIIEREEELEEAPIILQNPRIAKPFEGLTKMFGLPKYNEIDPTFFIAPTFCIFFGFMLTDTIYGIALIIAGIFTLRTMGKRSDNAAAAGYIMIGCGISAIFFGVLTGSYLGDFFAKSIFGVLPNDMALWLDPMFGSNAMTVLMLTCAIGFMHIMFGHFLGIYDNLRRKDRKTAIFEHAAWYVFIGGVVLAALPMAGMLPQTYTYVGGVLGVVGLLMLVKGLGFMAFIDLIGLVGNTLSYARILAMALTTAGIAMSFNFLAGMAYQIPYIGILVGAAVFIFGHVINILINSLGAFVHSLRLQYVEHFGAYYSGGGTAFKPFREKRIHTIVER